MSVSFDSEMHVKLVTLTCPIDEDEGWDWEKDLDLIPVNAARVSVNNRSDEFSTKDAGLIDRLIRDRHGTPFEHANMGFLVEVPIFVERQWRTHRWSSFNEHSGRYSVMLPKAYVPTKFVKNVGSKMNYEREDMNAAINTMSSVQVGDVYEYCWDTYQALTNNGVANEQARIVLPVGFYTKFYWTANLRSIANFLSLRNDVHAQAEIRAAAAQVEDYFSEYFPYSYKAFVDNGRQPLGG